MLENESEKWWETILSDWWHQLCDRNIFANQSHFERSNRDLVLERFVSKTKIWFNLEEKSLKFSIKIIIDSIEMKYEDLQIFQKFIINFDCFTCLVGVFRIVSKQSLFWFSSPSSIFVNSMLISANVNHQSIFDGPMMV